MEQGILTESELLASNFISDDIYKHETLASGYKHEIGIINPTEEHHNTIEQSITYPLLQSTTSDLPTDYITGKEETQTYLILNPSEDTRTALQLIPSDSLPHDFLEKEITTNALNNETTTNTSILHPTEVYQNPVEQITTTPPVSAELTSEQHEMSGQNRTIASEPQPRKRQKKSCSQNWSVIKNKEQREKGKAYLGKKKIDDKWKFVEPRSVRNIKDRCNCKLSLKGGTKLQCDKISDEERKQCFEKFRNMTWKEKKIYIKMLSICKSKQREREPLCITSFSNLFEELNLSLFRPKKDLCDICESFKTGNVTESDYEVHRSMKEEARRELTKDSASNHEVLTMDLQSVLLSPRSNISALYYKTKLIVHILLCSMSKEIRDIVISGTKEKENLQVPNFQLL
ncbi:unnamed protein product [Parnassius apollo]|uniref:(apollo) hypothetical protein n=1 Tax=Parnassius apollo TaxID=110799 RepID=A0A8S3Y9V4_PARAO|nr:unnamed protein product [Parnassius apollo]